MEYATESEETFSQHDEVRHKRSSGSVAAAAQPTTQEELRAAIALLTSFIRIVHIGWRAVSIL
jgi:hypothetical protein